MIAITIPQTEMVYQCKPLLFFKHIDTPIPVNNFHRKHWLYFLLFRFKPIEMTITGLHVKLHRQRIWEHHTVNFIENSFYSSRIDYLSELHDRYMHICVCIFVYVSLCVFICIDWNTLLNSTELLSVMNALFQKKMYVFISSTYLRICGNFMICI